MHFRLASNFQITSAVLLLSMQVDTAVSEDYRIELRFEQVLTTEGEKVFSVRATFQRDDVNNMIVAPNGQIFNYRDQSADFLTSQQFQAIAFGGWAAKTAASQLAFEVPAIGLDHAAFKTPENISPVPGSVVPEKFTMNWQGEDRGFVEVYKRTNLEFRSAFHPSECCSTTLHNELIAPGVGSLDLDVYTRTFLPTPQIISQSPLSTDTFTLQAFVRSRTPRFSYTVVPEPSGILLIAMAGMTILTFRRR